MSDLGGTVQGLEHKAPSAAPQADAATVSLLQRVHARDRLMHTAEQVGSGLHDDVMAALRRGDLPGVEAAIARNDAAMAALVEDMRVYQAELHEQAIELEEGRQRNDALMARFETLFTHLPVAVMLVDANGAILSSNLQAARLFGHEGAGASPRFLRRLVGGSTYQVRLSPALQRAALDRVTSVDDVDFVTVQGRHFVGEVHLALLPLQAGTVAQMVCAVLDRSDHIEAERARAAATAAEQAAQVRSALLSRMSHELRTPLNAVLGFAQVMRMEAEAGDLTLKPERLGIIESAGRHLLDLVNEVLDVARIEAGRMEVNCAPFDLAEVVTECLQLLGNAAAARKLAWPAARPVAPWLAELPAVCADRLRVKAAVINLLSNAIKYNRLGGEVRLSAQVCGAALELAVADTGLGLQPQQLEHLFEPFNRLGAERHGIEGTGLGLYVTRQFALAMGGDLRVSSSPGEGSVFTLRLPLAGLG